ncbi:MAG: helix-turn-helix domain-containing protein [Alphaproteobacteria bacterium]|mgnify:FL=1|nr:helix-turn-helix domain-containing protein [Alphaproteobacteria bacterium]MBT4964848.1 helix-turn-helix domain-containing protein [Alphaproteobacteria bacterium]
MWEVWPEVKGRSCTSLHIFRLRVHDGLQALTLARLQRQNTAMKSEGTQSWTTGAVRESERFDYWREVVCETFVELDPRPLHQSRFYGEVEASRVGDFGIAQIAASAQKVVRSRREISRANNPCYFLNIQLEGSGLTAQGGRESVLVPSDMVLLDATRPFEMTFNDRFSQMSLTISDSVIGQLPPAAQDDLAGLFINRNLPEARLLKSYGSLMRDQGDVEDHMFADLMTKQLAGIFHHAVNRRRGLTLKQADHWGQKLLTTIKAAVRRDLGNAGHTPARTADKVGVSVRLLHQAFARNGETFGRWLLAERLDTARGVLADSHNAHQSIAEVAYALGFADQSHFGRAFKARFCQTPKQFRKAAFNA